MIDKDFQDFVTKQAGDRGVSKSELEALLLAMKGNSTAAIANQLQRSEDAVRKRLSEVYRKFDIKGEGPVKLAKLQQLLLTGYQKQTQSTVSVSSTSVSLAKENTYPRHDLSQAPDVSDFCGREDKLKQLKQWIVTDRCRLVALWGMAGIGKAALCAKLAEQIKDEFDCTIWRSLRNAPSIEDFLADLIKFVSNQQQTELPTDVEPRISLLIEYFSKYRCLLLLDDVEEILHSRRCKPEYENYGLLFTRLAETLHQSCLLLNSQEEFIEIRLLERKTQLVRSLPLKELEYEDAKAILEVILDKKSDEKDWRKLVEYCGGNPFGLKVAATSIKALFNGDVSEYLRENTWVFGDWQSSLKQEYDKFSNLETKIISTLASAGKSMSLDDLKKSLLKTESLSTSDLMERLGDLIQRTWIETEKISNENQSHETRYKTPYYINKFIDKYHRHQKIN